MNTADQRDSGHWVNVPGVNELLDGYAVPAWLQTEATALLTSRFAFDRIVGVGLCARLGAALSPEPNHILDQLLAGRTSPASRAQTWAATLTGRQLATFQQDFVTEVDSLDEAVRGLRDLVAGASVASSDLARAICTRRDDLECFATVLRSAGKGATADILAGVDDDASAAATTFALAGTFDPPDRLVAIFSTQPEAWWGRTLVDQKNRFGVSDPDPARRL